MAGSRRMITRAQERNQGRRKKREERTAARQLAGLSVESEVESESSPPPPPPPPKPVVCDARKLPTVLSCFFNRRLWTRELMFNFGRCTSITAVKGLVNRYFAHEWKRLDLPTTIKFMGINCFKPQRLGSTIEEDSYWTISTDEEYEQWFSAIIKPPAYVGQAVRLQVCMMGEADAERAKKALSYYFDSEQYHALIEPYHNIHGPEWLLEMDLDETKYYDRRTFEMDADDEQVVVVRAHKWREATAAEQVAQDAREEYNVLEKKLKQEKNELADANKELRSKNRGLKALLKEHGISTTEDKIDSAAKGKEYRKRFPDTWPEDAEESSESEPEPDEASDPTFVP